jgi:hypothetical protein
MAACLRPPYTLPRTPSFGLMLSLAAEPSSLAITVRNVRTSSAPLLIDARLLSLSRKSCRAALPCALLARLAAHLELTGKMRRTDLCNRRSKRAPENRSTPEPAACAAKTASAMSRSVSPDAIRIAAPDHLAAIRAPGGSAFDDAAPASDDPPASLSLNEEVTSPARKRRFPGAAFSAARRAGEPASDAPCRAPRLTCRQAIKRSARIAFTTLASTRAASPIRGAFHRQVLPSPLARREPATVPAALPPQAGFRRSFAPRYALA